jgi:hypothetical protein
MISLFHIFLKINMISLLHEVYKYVYNTKQYTR